MINSLPEQPPTFVSIQEGRSGGPAFVSHEDECSLPVTKKISSLPELQPTFVSIQEGRSGGPAFVSHEDECFAAGYENNKQSS